LYLIFIFLPRLGTIDAWFIFSVNHQKHSPVVHEYASLRIKRFCIMFAPKIYTFTSHGLRINSD